MTTDQQQLYRFSVIGQGSFPLPVPGETMLDLADQLGARDATDLTVSGHVEGVALEADRRANSLSTAIASAIEDAEAIGLRVLRIEIEHGEFAEPAA